MKRLLTVLLAATVPVACDLDLAGWSQEISAACRAAAETPETMSVEMAQDCLEQARAAQPTETTND